METLSIKIHMAQAVYFRSTLPNLGMETFSVSVLWFAQSKSFFRSTLPNLGMETNTNATAGSLRECSFDQLSPTWGWKRLSILFCKITALGMYFRSTLPNLGMETWILATHVKACQLKETFDQLSPTWGWKLKRKASERIWAKSFFRSTLPNLGMETFSGILC